MNKLKELTIDQIKSWGLTTNQLKAYIEAEIKRTEKLQEKLTQAQIELNKTVKDASAKTQSSLSSNLTTNSLISTLINLRNKNIEIQNEIEKTTLKQEKEEGLSKHEKYARVMENLSG